MPTNARPNTSTFLAYKDAGVSVTLGARERVGDRDAAKIEHNVTMDPSIFAKPAN